MIVSNKIRTKSRSLKISSSGKAISKSGKISNGRIKTAIANRNRISAEQAR